MSLISGLTLPYTPEQIKEFGRRLSHTCLHDSFWDSFSRRLAAAYLRTITPGTPRGQLKTKKHREVDAEVFEALAWVAADHPKTPLGYTDAAVRQACAMLWQSIQFGD